VLAGMGTSTAALRRVDWLGTVGWLISTKREELASLWELLVDAGVTPAGGQAFHALRIEAGYPLHGIDIGSDNLAQEAGRSQQAISFTKGCYLGQEPIARLDALGHVNRQVSRLRLETASKLDEESTVWADQKQVGRITSAVHVPGEEYSVALGMLRISHASPGTELTVCSGDEQIHARVEGAA
jgi:folate-binding protein YgfZ